MSNGTIVVPQQSKTIITVPVTTYQSIVQPQTGPIVYMSLATRDTVGVVKIGEGINISQDGTISFDKSEVTIKSVSLNGQQLTPDSNKNVAINLTKSSVGLDQVDNTSDANKPLSLSMIAALKDKQNQINSKLDKQQGSANAGKILRVKSDGTIGLFNYESYDNLVPRVLDIESFIPQGTTTTNTLVNKSEIADVPHLVNGKLPDSVIPKSAITNTYVVNTHAEMLALTDVEEGDVCIVNEESKTYILQTEPSGWIEMKTSGGNVSSVNGKTGTVVLTLRDISTDVVTISENQEITSLKNFTQRPTVNGTQIALVTDTPELSGCVKDIKNDYTENSQGFRFIRQDKIDKVLSFADADFNVLSLGPLDMQDQRIFSLKDDVVRTNKLNNFTILPTVNNVTLATTAITDALNERIDGMIAASLETLADVSLSNIDSAGKQVIKDNGGTDVKVNNVKQTEINFTSNPQTQLNKKVSSALDGGWDDEQNSLVLSRTPYDKDRIYFNSRDFTPKIPVTNQVAGDITTYITVELNDTIARTSQIPSILDAYPVGAVYISKSSTSPASLFGGTWSAIESGYFLEATTTAGQGGQTVEAGLPNITGQAQMSVIYTSDLFVHDTNGALSSNTTGDIKKLYSVEVAENQPTGIRFDASKSNSIYGNSTTVQPKSIKYYMWERVS